jgi:hypothetical protein
MAAVRIHTGINPHDTAALVPRSQWMALVRARRTECNHTLRGDCRQLIFFIEDAAKFDWLGFEDREAYIRDGLHLDPPLVEWAVEGLRRLDGVHAIPFDEAVVLGKREIGIEGGTAGPGRGHKTDSNRTRFKGGTNERYTLARLRRDRPELAGQVERGELSANAAAIEAGFRKRQVQLASDPRKAAAAIIAARGLRFAKELAAVIAVWEEQ